MQIINIHHPYDPEKLPQDDVVLALGFFDGVHRGHQEVINTAKKIANEKGLKLAVMTFNHHPAVVFQKIDHKKMKYITTIEQKEERMTRLGVDYLYVIEFTSSFAGLSPQEFVDEYMVGLHAKVVVAGFDYTYGKKDTANMSVLPTYAKDRFEIVEVQKLSDREEKVSSTAIRECMKIGDMRAANQLLGYAYETTGVVVHGDKRGRLLGFPTANIKAPSYSLLPKVGVYVVKIKVADKWYMGMAQIGYNITFETNRPMTIEVNILDFSDDIYGEQVSVEWLHFLRGEKKFDNVDGLIAQLKQDEQDTREYFDNLGGLV
ncbi:MULTISPECIES: bifunctional riboflavin kinase/FAD synthetase [Vagococcus]|uniref:bifunctional riboflavin kinase/FAD synthetase n=1 Tax=Vagococcus TaxID=2737 RepID=UPI000E47550E|nr:MULTISPECIES: bifunctional riboflavin kinase/FAD synthetase [Vagococcus]RHH69569.1 bifunctional riboflavin kinase/FAD synthetase [Vagococcus sp. AM17-17]